MEYNIQLNEQDKITFAEKMCSGSIVEGLDNGQEILNLIKNAGY